MPKYGIRKAIVYGALICLVSAYKDLECKLALKTFECELYKSLVETCVKKNTEEKGEA